MAPAIWLGAVLGILSAGLPLPPAIAIGAGYSLEACAAVFLIRRFYRNPSNFIYHENIFRFIAIALAGSMIGASIGTAGIALAGATPTAGLTLGWLTWWLGDATGMIIGVPLLLEWNIRSGMQWNAAKIVEGSVFAILLPAITQISFGGLFGDWPLAFLPIPFVIWAAFRFTLPAVTWTTAIICAIAVWNTTHGNGPFASDSLNISLLLLMIYVSVIGTIGLALASQIYQRGAAESSLKAERDGLEQRVLMRTDALTTNIEELKRVEQELARRERELLEAQQLAQVGSWTWDIDTGAITWSDQLCRIYGVSKESFDVTPENCRKLIHPDDLDMLTRAVGESRETGNPFHVEHRIVLPDGSTRIVAARGQRSEDGTGRVSRMVGTVQDITERKRTVEQMAYLAHYDSLTGLANRILFHQRLEHALTIAARPGRSLEILFLDLDRFKNINDTLGHATGDIVLKETAARLQGTLRESDTVARLGGDEFVVLVENVDEPHRGGIIAEKILAAFAPSFLSDSNPLTITSSIGISSFPSDGTDADTLLKKADIAMYRAKEIGRNSYRYYSPEMNLHTAERLSLEYALSHAIEQNQLSLHYQPKIDIVTNRISGMEALLRWQHPTMGMVPTHQFIPVAEETGLIKPIGYWAMRTACLQNKYWQQTGPARLKVAVNLSPRQLADDKLIEHIGEILRDTELEPGYLELELTENAVMADPDKAIQLLNTLREMGISVAIDNFGISYSSLAYLKQFPIRAIKIDRSFVQGIPLSRGDSAITKAIIGLAHSLECSVIAEGAETQQQYDFLREHECDSVQGYYFSAPMPADHFEDLIKVQSNLHLH